MTAPTEAGPTARPPWLARMKLTEPVRLYLYTVLLVLLVGCQLAGVLTGEWRDYLATSAALLLAIPAGAEAVRASVYSPASMVRLAYQAAAKR